MQLDLTAMSGRELRAALNSARDRGQAQQSYAILQELARRREEHGSEARSKPKRLGRRRVADEPRIINLDLGDPLEPREDELWDLPEPPEAQAEPTPIDAPLVLEREPRKAPPPPPAPAPPTLSRRRKAPVAVFVAGATLGVALGAAGGFVGALTSLPFPAPAGASVQTAQVEAAPLPVGSLAPPPAPVVAEPPPPPEPPVDPAAVATPPEGLELAVASPDAADVAADASAAEPSPAPAKVEKAVVAETEKLKDKPKDKAEPTCTTGAPADRTICKDPELQRLQKTLQHAYAEALSAHADRTTLRERQLAWRDARDDVADPQRLAALYEARIKKLESATADARRLQR